MSDNGFSRRAVTIGGGIAAALGITALGVTVPRLLRHRHRQTPYDDLLSQLIDRDAAAKLGAQLDRQGEPQAVASELRRRFERRTLAEVINADLAEGKLTEVKGWVMPATLVLLCGLAASAES
jgi:hypothetical protein